MSTKKNGIPFSPSFIWIILLLKGCASYQKTDGKCWSRGPGFSHRPLSVDPWSRGWRAGFTHSHLKVHHSSPFQWAIFTFLSEKVKLTGGILRKAALYSWQACFGWVIRGLSCAAQGEWPLSWRLPAALPISVSDLCPHFPWGEVVGRRTWWREAVDPWCLLKLSKIFQIKSNCLKFSSTFINKPMWDKNSIMTVLKIQ